MDISKLRDPHYRRDHLAGELLLGELTALVRSQGLSRGENDMSTTKKVGAAKKLSAAKTLRAKQLKANTLKARALRSRALKANTLKANTLKANTLKANTLKANTLRHSF
jgi:hypothetical protein